MARKVVDPKDAHPEPPVEETLPVTGESEAKAEDIAAVEAAIVEAVAVPEVPKVKPVTFAKNQPEKFEMGSEVIYFNDKTLTTDDPKRIKFLTDIANSEKNHGIFIISK